MYPIMVVVILGSPNSSMVSDSNPSWCLIQVMFGMGIPKAVHVNVVELVSLIIVNEGVTVTLGGSK